MKITFTKGAEVKEIAENQLPGQFCNILDVSYDAETKFWSARYVGEPNGREYTYEVQLPDKIEMLDPSL